MPSPGVIRQRSPSIAKVPPDDGGTGIGDPDPRPKSAMDLGRLARRTAVGVHRAAALADLRPVCDGPNPWATSRIRPTLRPVTAIGPLLRGRSDGRGRHRVPKARRSPRGGAGRSEPARRWPCAPGPSTRSDRTATESQSRRPGRARAEAPAGRAEPVRRPRRRKEVRGRHVEASRRSRGALASARPGRRLGPGGGIAPRPPASVGEPRCGGPGGRRPGLAGGALIGR